MKMNKSKKILPGTLYQVREQNDDEDQILSFISAVTKKYEEIGYPEVLMYLETTRTPLTPVTPAVIERHWFLTSKGTKVYHPSYCHREWFFKTRLRKISL